MTWQKWISALLLVPVLGYVLLCLGVYLWGAGALPADRQPNRQFPSPLLRTQYLASEGIRSADGVRLNPLTVSLYLFRERSPASNDLRLPAHAGRALVRRSAAPIGGLRRHAAELAAMIYVSRAWSVDEQIATVLNEGYFGRDARGLTAAANAWYGQPPEALRPEESLALLVLTRGPSFYDPLCRPGRFNHRFRILSTRLDIADKDAALARARERLRPVACGDRSVPVAAFIPLPVSSISS
ncbi:transglycosylase domain-containing protein [Pseudoxanthomonas beigongshangi]